MRHFFKKQQVRCFNAELFKDIKELSRYPDRCECLEALSESADLIEWLKSATGS